MLSGSQSLSSSKQKVEQRQYTIAEMKLLMEQSAERNIPAEIMVASIQGNLAQINENENLSAQSKQWLYMVAFKNGCSAAGEKLTLNSKIDLLYEAANRGDLTLCQNVLVYFNKAELGDDEDGEISAIFNAAMYEHHFAIASVLLTFFNGEKFISENVICENVLWAATMPDHDRALKWLLAEAPIPADSIDAHIKGEVLVEMVKRDDSEMVQLLLQCLTPKDKLASEFLDDLQEACQEALRMNLLVVLKLLLPLVNHLIIENLLKEASGRTIPEAMFLLLERAEKISKSLKLPEEKAPLSHAEQAKYLKSFLENYRLVLSYIYSQAQTHDNQAILQLLASEINFTYKPPLAAKPPIVFSSEGSVVTSPAGKKREAPSLEMAEIKKEEAQPRIDEGLVKFSP